MLSTKKLNKVSDLFNDLIFRSQKDFDFRQEFIKNPIEFIEDYTKGKFTFNNSASVIVEDQTDENIIYLNIPRKISYDDLDLEIELSDEQLDLVNGGEFFGTAAVVLGVVAAVVTIGYFIDDVLDGADQYYKENQ
jgi:hypothetical protein